MLPKGRRLQKQRMKWSGGTDLDQGKSRHTGVWEGHRHKGNSTLSQSRWDSVPLETTAGGWSEDRKTGNILEVKVLQTKRVWVSGIDITKYLSHKVAKINLKRILELLPSPTPKSATYSLKVERQKRHSDNQETATRIWSQILAKL